MPKKLSVNVVNEHGTVLVSADKIGLRDGKIAMSGNLMGTMPGQFYVHPMELYKATKMIDFKFIRGVLGLLRQGKKEYQAQLAEEAE